MNPVARKWLHRTAHATFTGITFLSVGSVVTALLPVASGAIAIGAALASSIYVYEKLKVNK